MTSAAYPADCLFVLQSTRFAPSKEIPRARYFWPFRADTLDLTGGFALLCTNFSGNTTYDWDNGNLRGMDKKDEPAASDHDTPRQ